MTDRPTPRLDRLLACLEIALETRGLKTQLARELAGDAGIDFRSAKNRLSAILARRILPNGEDTLFLAAWLDGRKPAASAKRTGKRC